MDSGKSYFNCLVIIVLNLGESNRQIQVNGFGQEHFDDYSRPSSVSAMNGSSDCPKVSRKSREMRLLAQPYPKASFYGVHLPLPFRFVCSVIHSWMIAAIVVPRSAANSLSVFLSLTVSDNDSVVRFSSATTPARAGVSSVSDSAYWLLNRFNTARYVD